MENKHQDQLIIFATESIHELLRSVITWLADLNVNEYTSKGNNSAFFNVAYLLIGQLGA